MPIVNGRNASATLLALSDMDPQTDVEALVYLCAHGSHSDQQRYVGSSPDDPDDAYPDSPAELGNMTNEAVFATMSRRHTLWRNHGC
jgi:hypothetical protein